MLSMFLDSLLQLYFLLRLKHISVTENRIEGRLTFRIWYSYAYKAYLLRTILHILPKYKSLLNLMCSRKSTIVLYSTQIA